jgi:hypothetical protein
VVLFELLATEEGIMSSDEVVARQPILDRRRIGRQLLTAAWGIEILAASIGLLIASAVVIGTQQSIGELSRDQHSTAVGFMNAFLGGLPFIVVAAVELTKIPLATACYHARSRIWKFTLFVGILFLAFITFETILNGFERNFTQRTYVIKNTKKNLITTESEIANLNSDITELKTVNQSSLRDELTKDTNQIERSQAAELTDIDDQIQEAKIRYSGREAANLKEQKSQVDRDIIVLESRHTELLSEADRNYERELSQIKDTLKQKRSTIENELSEVRKDLNRLRIAEQSDLNNVKDVEQNNAELITETKRIEEDFASRISEIRSTISKERSRFEKREKDIAVSLKTLVNERDGKIESENSSRPFTAKNVIVSEINDLFAPRINSTQSELDGIKIQLRNLSEKSAVEVLQREKNEAVRLARIEFANISTRGSREREAIRERYTNEKGPIEIRLSELNSQLSQLNTRALDTEVTSKKDAQIRERDKNFESKRSKLIAQRDELAKNLANALKSTEDSLQPALDRLALQRDSVVKRYEQLRSSSQSRYSEKQEEVKDRESRIVEFDKLRHELSEKRLKLRDNIANYAEDSQIYRVAALWTGKDSAADVSNNELRIISLVWFGSLAAITAWTGTLLAFGGLVVQYGHQTNKGPLSSLWSGLLLSFRRLFVTWRRQRLRPREKIVEKVVEIVKEVVKEVPVNKVVYTEVPKEVVRRELVYVPFFTDDPQHLDGQTYSSMENIKDSDD